MIEQNMKQGKTGKVILLSTLGLVSYSGFLIANMSAATVWQYLPTRQLPVNISGITGTLWSGAAESVTLTVLRKPLALPAIRWQIEPASLLKGEVQVSVELGNAASPVEGQGTVVINRQTLTLNNVELDTTAPWLLASLQDTTVGNIPGEVQGNVLLELDELILNDKGCVNINGNAALTNSGLTSPSGQFDLGNSTAQLSCQNRSLIARVTQTSSIINSYGDFQLGTSGRYTFTGKMTPDASLPAPMKQGLAFLGQPDSNGAYAFSFKSSIK
ncbi:type II secretion system protein N [Endozoicomonas sp. GU-1]|uniref:type II secretion system protein N n=2 Tax=Endozoicomonas sp. GU-1 TaxID=3009078 RepID=UPI0022B5E23A|nr:type II secretion system protein N [Endozoicomonas sp. GU-1]WBA82065.1 type II secretion system protein N [Endozoicomonas sp. GU-1]